MGSVPPLFAGDLEISALGNLRHSTVGELGKAALSLFLSKPSFPGSFRLGEALSLPELSS